MTVPEDGAELLAELRRHGVALGQRLHIVASLGSGEPGGQTPTPTRARRLTFIGMGRTDLAMSQDVDRYLAGFGEA